MQDFNALDIGIIVLFALSTLISIYRGFIREMFTLIVWTLALILAYTHGAALGSLFTFFSSDIIRQTVGSFIIFTTIILTGAILKRHVIKSMGIKHPGGIDRTIGALFGIARAGVIVVITLVLLDSAVITESPLFKDSKLLPDFQKAARFIDDGTEEKKWHKFKVKSPQPQDLPDMQEIVPQGIEQLDNSVGGTMDGDGQVQ